ncbi:uncharacterized protein LOC144312413 [Canis aureus]
MGCWGFGCRLVKKDGEQKPQEEPFLSLSEIGTQRKRKRNLPTFQSTYPMGEDTPSHVDLVEASGGVSPRSDPCCVSLSMHDQFAVIYGELPPQEFEACGMTLMVEFQESREASEDETSKQQRFLNTLRCLGHK